MKVCKFGGSSVSSKQQIDKVFHIMNNDEERKILIVSAPGTRFTGDTKLTDNLIDLYRNIIHHQPIDHILSCISQRFKAIELAMRLPEAYVISNDINDAIQKIIKQYQEDHERLLDAIISRGEYFNALLIANYFNFLGKKSVCLLPEDIEMYVTDEPSNAFILDESYNNIHQHMNNALKNHDYIIIPGFYGISKNNNIVTFSRGGSDITGSIIARSIGASIYENFTDVSGIYAVNPNFVPESNIIDKMSYRELRELTYAGFNVFHDEALMPLIHQNTIIQIKNTNAPNHKGTRIMMHKEKQGVIGIASSQGFSSINIKKFMMKRTLGFTRNLLQILEDYAIPYEHIPSGIDNLSIIVRTEHLKTKKEDLMQKINLTLNVDEIKIEDEIAIVMIVGEGMKTMIGTANKATKALRDANINIKMINQGASEISIMIGVNQSDEKQAIKALYQQYF